MSILLDTGVIVALFDRDDAWHAKVVSYLDGLGEGVIVPLAGLCEVAYLLRKYLGPHAELDLTRWLVSGDVDVRSVAEEDLHRMIAVMTKYPDLGFIDASIVALAERLAVTTIATTNRRHFGAVRPRHVARFTLAP